MALGALESEVNSVKSKIAMEISSELPATFGVAAGTALAKLTVVDIFVAGQTFACYWLVANEWNVFSVLGQNLAHVRLMALSALHSGVLVKQFVV